MKYQPNRHHGVEYQEAFDIAPASRQRYVGAHDYETLFYRKLDEFDVILAGVTTARECFAVQRLGAPFHTVLLSAHGEAEALDENGWQTIRPHDFVVLPKGGLRGFRLHGEVWRFGWFLLRDTPRWHALNTMGNVIYPDQHTESIFDALSLLCREVEAGGAHNPFATGALSLTMGILSQSLAAALDKPHMERRLLTLFDAVKQDYSREWRVDELAARLGVTPGYFHKLCITHMRMAPSQLLLNLRMEKALQLLMSGAGNVSEVAAQLGYREVASFSRRFRRHFGQNPSQVMQHEPG
ncbi:AraC-type DNA-binding protein [Andreprevotia lacus DSM 23236]|jgi:AraC-like DNA-binding protein|uniref:AraC-type DNA-binding protein n=1 Tax=Andreprevotia lacus DSM 23236 TaxID=1121001 RepID=A0A1W1XBK6_9NEIS|nr:helix-turn-helix transcriptional regulator [Andreprevotia lacus]SMC21272.1 AraC-type DNA-binding protein [Andreprevotia lacus DSM 23236]